MDKPKMYQNKVDKEFHNNKLVYVSYDNRNNYMKSDVRKKATSIINSNSFIYSKLVHIKIDDNIIMRKIIGIYNDNIVTIDNEYIPIDNIQDIYIW